MNRAATVTKGSRRLGLRKGSGAEILSVFYVAARGGLQVSIRFPDLAPPIRVLWARVRELPDQGEIELSRAAPLACSQVWRETMIRIQRNSDAKR